METIYTGLLAGFIVGVVCVVYVLLRSWYVDSQLQHSNAKLGDRDAMGNNWLIMGVLSSSSIIWGFLGAGVYHLLKSYYLFFLLFFAISLLVALYLAFKKTPYKFDKIVLNLLIFNGLGFLIPYMYP